MSGKQKTAINNLESEEQANYEEFISFSRGGKRSWKEKAKRLSKIRERHSGAVQDASKKHILGRAHHSLRLSKASICMTNEKTTIS